MKILTGVLAITACVLSGSTYASGLYMYGAMGQSRVTYPKQQTDALLGTSGSTDDNPDAYMLNVGYEFAHKWMIEGGRAELGTISYRGAGVNVSGKGTATSVTVARLVDIGGDNSTFPRTYFVAKIGLAHVKSEAKVTGQVSSIPVAGQVSGSKNGATFGLGFRIDTDEHWSVRLAADSFDPGTPDVHRFQVYTFGISYQFN